MGRIDEAERKLDQAVDRLEAAAERVAGSRSAAKVESELSTLRQRCQTLEAHNAEISRRLDAAIGRIRKLLDADRSGEAGDGAG